MWIKKLLQFSFAEYPRPCQANELFGVHCFRQALQHVNHPRPVAAGNEPVEQKHVAFPHRLQRPQAGWEYRVCRVSVSVRAMSKAQGITIR